MACIDKNGKEIKAGDSCSDSRLGTSVTVSSTRGAVCRFQFKDTAGVMHRGRDCVDNT